MTSGLREMIGCFILEDYTLPQMTCNEQSRPKVPIEWRARKDSNL